MQVTVGAGRRFTNGWKDSKQDGRVLLNMRVLGDYHCIHNKQKKISIHESCV
jgi:hypothetical protein